MLKQTELLLEVKLKIPSNYAEPMCPIHKHNDTYYRSCCLLVQMSCLMPLINVLGTYLLKGRFAKKKTNKN